MQVCVKYFAAREVWKKRAEDCPVPQKVDGFKRVVTWQKWFAIKFGEDLNEYVARIQRDGKPPEVVALAGGHS
jgi:hypothetical protein